MSVALFKLSYKKKDELNPNIIKSPKLFLISSLGFLGFVIIVYPISVFFSPADDQIYVLWAYPLIMSFFVIPCLLFTLYSLNWKVEVFDDYVIYHNLFNKVKIFYFKDVIVKNYSATVRILKPYKNKKGKKKNKLLVNISCYCSNYEILMKKFKNYKLNKN